MKTTLEYLDDAKKALGIESDYAMAKWMGVTKQSVSMWRKSPSKMDVYAASRIAEALKIDPMEVIAVACMEREKDESRAEYWRKWCRNCSIGFFFVAILTDASGVLGMRDAYSVETVYTLCAIAFGILLGLRVPEKHTENLGTIFSN